MPDHAVDARPVERVENVPAGNPTITERDNLLAGLRGSLQADCSTVMQATHGCASLVGVIRLAVTDTP